MYRKSVTVALLTCFAAAAILAARRMGRKTPTDGNGYRFAGLIGLLKMESSREQILGIIEMLKKVMSRPKLFVWTTNNIRQTEVYLSGFTGACLALGHSYSRDIQCQVLKKHGWEMRSDGAMSQMMDSGMNDEEIVRILILFEIEMWEARLSEIDAGTF